MKHASAALLAALVLAPVQLASGQQVSANQSHWKPPGCTAGLHGSALGYKRATEILKNHVPLTSAAKERLRRGWQCVRSRKKAHAVHRHVRKLYAWRMQYAHRWPIRFNALPSWDRSWAWSTGACESGNNPATNTGNGFHGAFQFVLSTWWAAGGTGVPEQHSWHYQAVIAVGWMHRAGAGQWPVCGR